MQAAVAAAVAAAVGRGQWQALIWLEIPTITPLAVTVAAVVAVVAKAATANKAVAAVLAGLAEAHSKSWSAVLWE